MDNLVDNLSLKAWK